MCQILPLIVLEEFLLVALVQIVRHSVRPLQRRAAPLDLLYSLARKLYFDPSEVRGDLHLLHLLLGLRVQLHGQLRRLLVIRPPVVILWKFSSD